MIRKRDENDRRYYHLYLTEKAKRLAPRIWEARARWAEVLSKGFSEEEKDMIYDYLSKAAQNAAAFKERGFTPEKD